MMTARLERNWKAIPGGIAVPAANSWSRGTLLRGAGAALRLPPAAIPMDPSDRGTWSRPVRFT